MGRLVPTRDSRWVYLAFTNEMPDGGFGGTIIDPRPVSVIDARLVVLNPGTM